MAAPLQTATITYEGQPTSVAYRRHHGPAATKERPLFMLIHYRANLHFWDPLLIKSLASKRPVIVFDLPGTGSSGGKVPTSYQAWGEVVLELATALNIDQFDLAGFSMGGRGVQMAALTAPQRVRKLILLGTDASTPKDNDTEQQRVLSPNPSTEAFMRLTAAKTFDDVKSGITHTFFYHNAVGKAAGDAYWKRVLEAVGGDESKLLPLDEAGTKDQIAASQAWSTPGGSGHGSIERLGELKMPVLVCNGDDDVLCPSLKSWLIVTAINATSDSTAPPRKGAKLIIWPRTGHGFLWQYAEDVGRAMNEFLDDDGSYGVSSGV